MRYAIVALHTAALAARGLGQGTQAAIIRPGGLSGPVSSRPAGLAPRRWPTSGQPDLGAASINLPSVLSPVSPW
jgi:hypothetical protein